MISDDLGILKSDLASYLRFLNKLRDSDNKTESWRVGICPRVQEEFNLSCTSRAWLNGLMKHQIREWCSEQAYVITEIYPIDVLDCPLSAVQQYQCIRFSNYRMTTHAEEYRAQRRDLLLFMINDTKTLLGWGAR